MKNKKRKILILILAVGIVSFLGYKFWGNKENEKIYCASVTSFIYDNEINMEKFVNFQQPDYWLEKKEYRKFEFFDFNKTENLGQVFNLWYCVGFHKSLNGKIREVASELEITENAKENLMYYSTDGEQPFEGYRVEENGDGTYLIYICGVSRDKNIDDIKFFLQEITIHLYIQYEDGSTETKIMKINKNQIKLELVTDNSDPLLIEKEE